jgi:hypothetical protein
LATNLEESARRAGIHQWAESRLFEILGGWVANTPEPEVKVLFDRHSHHCAWRAAQWWDRLPVLAGVERSSLCIAPPGPAAPVLERLATLEGTVERMAVTYRLALPRLWAAYEGHRRAAADVADGSSVRTLGIVSGDLAADWREGEVQLQLLLSDSSRVKAAAAAVSTLEERLATED